MVLEDLSKDEQVKVYLGQNFELKKKTVDFKMALILNIETATKTCSVNLAKKGLV